VYITLLMRYTNTVCETHQIHIETQLMRDTTRVHNTTHQWNTHEIHHTAHEIHNSCTQHRACRARASRCAYVHNAVLKITGLFCKRTLRKRRCACRTLALAHLDVHHTHYLSFVHLPRFLFCASRTLSLMHQKNTFHAQNRCTKSNHVTALIIIIGEHSMGWLQLVSSLKLQVSFEKEPYERDFILQKGLTIWRSQLIVATP